MNTDQIARLIKLAMDGRKYSGSSLSRYAARSIEESRSNYPVTNLLAYLNDSGLKLVMRDGLTLDTFSPRTVLEVHQVIGELMGRYRVEPMMVYRKTGMYYSQPKSLDPEILSRMEKEGEKYTLPLSINVLLAVCETLRCDVLIEADESSADLKTNGYANKETNQQPTEEESR